MPNQQCEGTESKNTQAMKYKDFTDQGLLY